MSPKQEGEHTSTLRTTQNLKNSNNTANNLDQSELKSSKNKSIERQITENKKTPSVTVTDFDSTLQATPTVDSKKEPTQQREEKTEKIEPIEEKKESAQPDGNESVHHEVKNEMHQQEVKIGENIVLEKQESTKTEELSKIESNDKESKILLNSTDSVTALAIDPTQVEDMLKEFIRIITPTSEESKDLNRSDRAESHSECSTPIISNETIPYRIPLSNEPIPLRVSPSLSVSQEQEIKSGYDSMDPKQAKKIQAIMRGYLLLNNRSSKTGFIIFLPFSPLVVFLIFKKTCRHDIIFFSTFLILQLY